MQGNRVRFSVNALNIFFRLWIFLLPMISINNTMRSFLEHQSDPHLDAMRYEPFLARCLILAFNGRPLVLSYERKSHSNIQQTTFVQFQGLSIPWITVGLPAMLSIHLTFWMGDPVASSTVVLRKMDDLLNAASHNSIQHSKTKQSKDALGVRGWREYHIYARACLSLDSGALRFCVAKLL